MSAVLCYIAGLRDTEHAASGPMGGVIFETAVLSGIVKSFVHRGEEPKVYFWRTLMSLRDTKGHENVNPVTLNLVQGLNEMLKQVQHDIKKGFSDELLQGSTNSCAGNTGCVVSFTHMPYKQTYLIAFK